MNKVNIVWSTPDGEALLGYIARVSNPNAKPEDDATKLIRYLIKHKHWSPFDMVNICVELEGVPRDVTRQIIRHTSMKFQEFSGRYAAYQELLPAREARLQDPKNRQKSIDTDPKSDLSQWWTQVQDSLKSQVLRAYEAALSEGIAKEVARAILPEGLVPSRMFINATLRSWIHYLEVRNHEATQKEHRLVAAAIEEELKKLYPSVFHALSPAVS